MILDAPIDTYEFLKHGHCQRSINPALRGSLLRSLERLEYEDMPADHCEAGARFRGQLEQAPAVQGFLALLWSRIAGEDLAALSGHFRAPASRCVTTVIRLGDGYELDWHNHLAARPTATLLIYLYSNGDQGTGGELVLGELGEDLRTPVEVHRYCPGHGDAILIGDMSHPLLMHKAARWHGPGWRYLLSFAFNSDDW